MSTHQHTHFTIATLDNYHDNQKLSWRKIAKVCGCKDVSCVYQWYKRHKDNPSLNTSLESNPKRKKSYSERQEQLIEEIIQTHDYSQIFNKIANTRTWSWHKWAKHFLRITLIHKQELWLKSMESEPTQLVASRQIGKTTVLQIFILRKLCESVFDYLEGLDKPILFVSHDFAILKKMFTFLRSNLLTNKAIISHYGLLINREKIQGLSEAVQSGSQIRLISLYNTYLVNFTVSTPLANVRGDEYYYIIIDDVIDVKKALKNPLEALKLTDRIEVWINYDLSPTIKGHILMSGTRYNQNDIYARNDAKRLYKSFVLPLYEGSLPAWHMEELGPEDIITPQHFIIDTPEDQITLVCNAPSLWSPNGKFAGAFEYSGSLVQNILYKLFKIGESAFKQEYLCQPTTFDNQLDKNNLVKYSILPFEITKATWVIFIDPASGKTALSDVTSFAMVGAYQGQFYIHRLIHGHWDGLEKQEQLLTFYEQAKLETHQTKVIVFDENVRNQDFHNRILREAKIQSIGYNPNDDKRGEKDQRIANNFGPDLKNRIVWLNDLISQKDKNKLFEEMDNFGNIHADTLDACDQAIYILRYHLIKVIKNRIYS